MAPVVENGRMGCCVDDSVGDERYGLSMMTSTAPRKRQPTPWQRTRDTLLDLVFPPRCAGCRQRGVWLCADCLALVPPLAPPLCAQCGKPLTISDTPPALCRSCRHGELPDLDWARAAYPFTGPLREAIHHFKYDKERARATHLGLALLPLLDRLPQDHSMAPLLLIPVPLSAARRRERGYNQAEALAVVLAANSAWPLATALHRTRATPPQIGLNRTARHQNVAGAFTWEGASLAGTRVLLVDDVLTTGATANACAVALKEAGAAWVGLVTVARASG